LGVTNDNVLSHIGQNKAPRALKCKYRWKIAKITKKYINIGLFIESW